VGYTRRDSQAGVSAITMIDIVFCMESLDPELSSPVHHSSL
jgi:hypothetical protein